MIYLDNAATTFPKPASVSKAVAQALTKYGANPGRSGHKMSLEASEEVYKCRKVISDFFNAEGPECIVFTLNCTQSTNMVIKGLLKENDHVVISCLEHNAITRPLYALEKNGVTFTEATVYPGDNDATLNSFRESITEKTKLIACMHASNVCGARLPIERIASLAHVYKIPILVDAAQSAGVLPIDMKESQIDYLCISGHKGLYGPMGTGILITSKGKDLSTIIEGGTGTNSISYLQPETMPDKFESGTPNVAGIVGLRAGVEFVSKRGIENISRYEHSLIEFLYDELKKIDGIEMYMPKPTHKYFVPLISFNFKNKDSEVIAALLDKHGICVRAGLHCTPSAHKFLGTVERGTVRVCPSVFTTENEIKFLIKVLKYFSKTLY